MPIVDCSVLAIAPKNAFRLRPLLLKAAGRTSSSTDRGLRLGIISNDQFLDWVAVAPISHVTLLKSITEGIFTVFPIESCVGEGIKQLPCAVIIEGVGTKT